MADFLKLNGQEFDLQTVQKMADAGLLVSKNDPSSLTATNDPPYGPYPVASGRYGVFSVPGVRPDFWSTHIDVDSGILRLLGLNPSVYENEKIGIMTGVQDATGDNATAFCTTAGPTPGALKRCVQNYVFGKVQWKTKIFCAPEMGKRRDRTDTDKLIKNQRRNPNLFVPSMIQSLDSSNPVESVMAKEFFELGAAMSRAAEYVVWNGNKTKASTATERGFIKEFDGISRLVKTGHTDLDSGFACEAADSTVIAFSASISGTAADGRDIQRTISDLVWAKKQLAEGLGMRGVQWVLAMHPRMFRELVYVWACVYASYRCTGTAGNPVEQMGLEVRRLQLEMMEGQYLLVDNMRVPVILSEGVEPAATSRAGDGIYNGDIYYLPISWNGFPLLHFEFKPMDNPDARAVINAFGPGDSYFANNGLFMVHKLSQAGVYEFIFQAEIRLILETPFLAGRVDDISYTFLVDEWRAALPSDTTYWKDGGTTYFSTPSPS